MSARNAFGWRDAVRVLPDDETRSYAARRLFEAGFSLDSIPSQKKAKETLCEALVRIEDRLEIKGHKSAIEARLRVRALRRRIELELWP